MVRNLATNPSFERVQPGTTVVRRNYAVPVNSTTVSASGRYSVANGATMAYDSTRQAAQLTPASGSAQSGITIFGAPPVRGTITISLDLESESGDTYLITGTAGWNGGIGYTLKAGEKRRIQRTITISAMSGALYVVRQTAGTTGRFWVSNLLIENLPAPAMTYFDANTVDDTGLAYAWEGAANASPSVAMATSVEVYRNLNRSPRGSQNRSLNKGSAATTTATYTVENGVEYMRFARPSDDTADTWRLANVVNPAAAEGSTGATAVVSGRAYTIMLRIRSSAPLAARLVPLQDGSTSNKSIEWSFPALTSAQVGQWVWVRATAVASANGGANNVLYMNFLAEQPVGTGYFDVAECLIVEGTYPGGYFDGDISPDVDLLPVWTGAVNNSASALIGAAVSGVTSAAPGTLAAFRSWQWPVDGTKASLRLTSFFTSASPTSAAFLTPSGLERGMVYTAIATARIVAPLAGSLRGERMCLQARGQNGTILATSAAPPNAAGAYQVWVTFTMPTTGSFDLRAYHGGVDVSGDVWFDNFAVVPGVYNAPYFDGDTVLSSWAGARHNSVSEKILPAVSVWDATKQEERWLNLPLTVDGA